MTTPISQDVYVWLESQYDQTSGSFKIGMCKCGYNAFAKLDPEAKDGIELFCLKNSGTDHFFKHITLFGEIALLKKPKTTKEMLARTLISWLDLVQDVQIYQEIEEENKFPHKAVLSQASLSSSLPGFISPPATPPPIRSVSQRTRSKMLSSLHNPNDLIEEFSAMAVSSNSSTANTFEPHLLDVEVDGSSDEENNLQMVLYQVPGGATDQTFWKKLAASNIGRVIYGIVRYGLTRGLGLAKKYKTELGSAAALFLVAQSAIRAWMEGDFATLFRSLEPVKALIPRFVPELTTDLEMVEMLSLVLSKTKFRVDDLEYEVPPLDPRGVKLREDHEAKLAALERGRLC